MHITAIVNSKGGTTKTTTAVNLATAAALQGERVLLVDLDKQRSATQWLSSAPDTKDLLDAIVVGRSLDDLVIGTVVEGLSLVPGTSSLAEASTLQQEPGYQVLVREALGRTTGFDRVFIDSPGDLGPSTIMALTAATDVLIPLPVGSMELDELDKVLDVVAKVRARLNTDLVMAGVLLTKFKTVGRHPRVLSRQVQARLLEEHPRDVFDVVVRDDDQHATAPAWHLPIALHDPDGRGDRDYRAALTELDLRVAAHV